MKTLISKAFFLLVVLGLIFPPHLICQKYSIKLKVVSELANIRIKPDIASVIIKQFPQGTLIDSNSKSGEWYKVQFFINGNQALTGYVHESLVIPLEGTQPEKKNIVLENKTEEIEKEEMKRLPEDPPPQKKETPPEKKKEEQVKVIPDRQNKTEYIRPQIKSSVYISGGGNFASPEDLNKGTHGLSNYYSDQLGVYGRGAVSDLKLMYQFGLEFAFPLNPKLSFLLGANYFLGKNKSFVDYSEGQNNRSFLSQPKVQAFPVRIGISYSLLSGLYAKAGIEFIIVNCRYFYRYEQGDFWQQWDGDANSQGLGAIGGLGFIMKINPVIGLFIETTGRYAKIKSFDGHDFFTDSNGSDSEEKGKLYLYNGQITGNKTYPLLYIRGKIPTEAGVSNPREASINLSGISIKAGIKINF